MISVDGFGGNMAATDMRYSIREVAPSDFQAWRRLRLEALRGEPFALAMMPEVVEAMSDLQIQDAIRGWEDVGSFVLGAFSESGQLLGNVGLDRKTFPKLRHRLCWRRVASKCRRELHFIKPRSRYVNIAIIPSENASSGIRDCKCPIARNRDIR